jgi:OPA family glycerol-3-phosphate transporter-like MFS transporter
MCVFWSINGFAQAMMWPPMVKILVGSMTEDEYGNSVIKIFCGSSAGTIFVYLVSPLIIELWSWKGVFVVTAVIGVTASVVWHFLKAKTELLVGVETSENFEPAPFKFPQEAIFPIAFIMIAITFQGMLRDGVTSWMPTYLAEVFEMGNSASILCTVSIAIFTTVSYFVTGWLYKKFFRTEVGCGIALYGVVLLFTLLQYLLFDLGAVFAIVCMTMTTSAIHGVNLMLVSHVPKRFKKYGNISTISGILNACTYVGSAIFTYGVAVLAETLGWRSTVGIWFIIGIFGVSCCLIAIKAWQRFVNKDADLVASEMDEKEK